MQITLNQIILYSICKVMYILLIRVGPVEPVGVLRSLCVLPASHLEIRSCSVDTYLPFMTRNVAHRGVLLCNVAYHGVLLCNAAYHGVLLCMRLTMAYM